jgi:hypothetical protein
MSAASGQSRSGIATPGRAALTRAVAYLVIVGMSLAVAWTYNMGYYLGRPFPHDTFLFRPADHFADLFNFFGPLDAGNPYSYAAAFYPPFAYITMEPFVWLGETGATVLWLVIAAAGVGAFVFRHLDYLEPADRVGCTIVLGFLTYPFVFAFDRGNIDVFATLALFGFAWAMSNGRSRQAALFVGAAGALKIYPFIFVAAFIARRDWRSVAYATGCALFLTFLGCGYYGFDVAHTLDLYSQRLSHYNDAYAVGHAGLGWGCSLFGPVKLVAVHVFHVGHEGLRTLVSIYTLATIGLALAGLAVLWRGRLALWQEVTVLTIAVNLLPTVSADYKLVDMVAPMILFLRDGADDARRIAYALLFGLLMIAKPYVLLEPDGTNLGVVLDPLLMVGLFALVVVSVRRGEAT